MSTTICYEVNLAKVLQENLHVTAIHARMIVMQIKAHPEQHQKELGILQQAFTKDIDMASYVAGLVKRTYNTIPECSAIK